MKIAIIGYSGSGKSTLANRLGEYYNCDVLHLDSIHFAPNWVEVTNDEMTAKMQPFLDLNAWVIDGNYSRVLYQQRMEYSDQIIILSFNRFSCLYRAFRRYLRYRGTTRSDMAVGCNEKFDLKFVRWILWGGRSQQTKARYQSIAETYKNKTVIIKNQRQLDRFMNTLK